MSCKTSNCCPVTTAVPFGQSRTIHFFKCAKGLALSGLLSPTTRIQRIFTLLEPFSSGMVVMVTLVGPEHSPTKLSSAVDRGRSQWPLSTTGLFVLPTPPAASVNCTANLPMPSYDRRYPTNTRYLPWFNPGDGRGTSGSSNVMFSAVIACGERVCAIVCAQCMSARE